jgi:hypothetical protein
VRHQPGLPGDAAAAGPSCADAASPLRLGAALSVLSPQAVYKRLLLLLRALACYVRVLPAYRLYRAAKVWQQGVGAGTDRRRGPAAAAAAAAAALSLLPLPPASPGQAACAASPKRR